MGEFNQRLKELRNERNIKQKDIADILKISVRAYQHYETGTRFPDFQGLHKLADYFNCSLDWLTGRVQKDYLSLIEKAEDEYLLSIAEERIKKDTGVRYSHEDIMSKHGITQKELDEIPMEYGVDFE